MLMYVHKISKFVHGTYTSNHKHLCMTVTTDGYTSSSATVPKMTVHLGFLYF